MNRIYSVIYSEAKNGYVVVSELARRHGKHTHSRRGKAAIAAAVLTALASVSCTGMPIAQAEVLDKPMDKPMTVMEKDTAIEKDVDVTIQAGDQPFHAIKIDNLASGGTIQINSKKITAHIQEAEGPQIRIDGIITNKGSVNGDMMTIKTTRGYEGTVTLADDLVLTVDSKGRAPKIAGIYENGFENLNGDITRRGLNQGGPADWLSYDIGKNTTVSLTGYDESIKAPDELATLRVYYSQTGIMNDGGLMNVGDNLHVSSHIDGKYTLNAIGISNTKYGKITIGDNAYISASGNLSDSSSGYGSEVYGLVSRHDHDWEKWSQSRGNQSVELGNNATISVSFLSHGVKDNNTPSSIAGMALWLGSTNFTAGKNLHLTTIQEDNGIGTYGLWAHNGSIMNIDDGFQTDVTAKGNGFGIYGIYSGQWRNHGEQIDGTKITFNGQAHENIKAAGSYQIFAHYFNAASLILNGNDNVDIAANGHFNHIAGAYMLNPGAELKGEKGSLSVNMDIQGKSIQDPYYEKTSDSHVDGLAIENQATATLNNLSVHIKQLKGSLMDTTQVTGMAYRPYQQPATSSVNGVAEESADNSAADDTKNIKITGTTNIQIAAENTGSADGAQVYGIYNQGGSVQMNDATIQLTGKKVGSISGVCTTDGGTTDVMGDITISVNGDAGKQIGIFSKNGGRAAFHKGVEIKGIDKAVEADGENSLVDISKDENNVIEGNIYSKNQGILRLSLQDAESSLTGFSTVDGGQTDLAVSDGARWNMTRDSQVTNLTLAQGGQIDMKANQAYQTLNADTFTGQNGTLYMKTDLASEKNGDKFFIKTSTLDSGASVQVDDASLTSGKEVTGVKNLLLITDVSKNAVFSGKSLDKGGLWDVTPTLQRGNLVKDAQGNIVGKDTEWYLTKIAKAVNHDTKPLIGAADYAYGAYRMDIETLRQRMGELRFLKDKKDESGIWARTYGGEFDGPGYDSRYHTLQLGYDYAANPKSFYGWFGERGIASPHYDYGTSSNHSLAAGIYGTWFGDSGVYTDAVAKWGRDDVNLHTSGSYPDKADYRTRAASLSLEYGKTMKLNDKGVFIEPQAQLVYGHLGSTHYTTAREKQVHMDDYDSFIGRVGFVFGRRTPDATKPLDYYLRLSALHEFGGRRAMQLSASDGETMDWSRDYGSTWYEASLGGTYRLSDRTTLYGDVQRTFGSDWHKKWQGNIGINWQF